jgi:hypothetical protein
MEREKTINNIKISSNILKEIISIFKLRESQMNKNKQK